MAAALTDPVLPAAHEDVDPFYVRSLRCHPTDQPNFVYHICHAPIFLAECVIEEAPRSHKANRVRATGSASFKVQISTVHKNKNKKQIRTHLQMCSTYVLNFTS